MKTKTKEASKKLSPRDQFISAVAVMLSSNLVMKSIKLEMRDRDALDWAKAFQAAGCHGYPTAIETEKAIRRTLEQTE